MKDVVYIGNRAMCLRVLIGNPQYRIVRIFTVENSYLTKYCIENGIDYIPFTFNDKGKIVEQLISLNYDILISNGCPFILPVDEISINGRLLINTHPTFLPQLRGAKALNGVFMENIRYMGATTHYMSSEIDAGNIIYQEKVALTDDIDQGLVYFISFDLESKVFRKALEILETHNYIYAGIRMNKSEGVYFSRKPDMQIINLEKESCEDIIKKIKSFGISSQGCKFTIGNDIYTAYDAEYVYNKYITNKFARSKAGTNLLEYDTSMLVKCIDGIVKIKRYYKNDNISNNNTHT